MKPNFPRMRRVINNLSNFDKLSNSAQNVITNLAMNEQSYVMLDLDPEPDYHNTLGVYSKCFRLTDPINRGRQVLNYLLKRNILIPEWKYRKYFEVEAALGTLDIEIIKFYLHPRVFKK